MNIDLLFQKSSLSNSLVFLRWLVISIQIALIFFVNLYLDYALPWQPLFLVILIESAFNLGCYIYNKKQNSDHSAYIFTQVLADVLFLGVLLYFSGGATNAFVSLLLIPIAISAVTLRAYFLITITVSAIVIYSILLWLMPMHVMHGNMQGHFIGMWLNFIFSAFVVSLFIAKMTQRLRDKDHTIAQFREKQLKQEKVMALGIASAQVTHDLATPLANIRLLTDELLEDINHGALDEMDKQVERCCENLHMFRQMSLKIKDDDNEVIHIDALIDQLKYHCNFYYPNVDIDYQHSTNQHQIVSNSALLPAILNVVNNAISASRANNKSSISITSNTTNTHWQLNIRDFGEGFLATQFSQMGNKQTNSQQGLGMGLLLSNSSFERLNGSLQLANHQLGGASVVITLPLYKA